MQPTHTGEADPPVPKYPIHGKPSLPGSISRTDTVTQIITDAYTSIRQDIYDKMIKNHEEIWRTTLMQQRDNLPVDLDQWNLTNPGNFFTVAGQYNFLISFFEEHVFTGIGLGRKQGLNQDHENDWAFQLLTDEELDVLAATLQNMAQQTPRAEPIITRETLNSNFAALLVQDLGKTYAKMYSAVAVPAPDRPEIPNQSLVHTWHDRLNEIPGVDDIEKRQLLSSEAFDGTLQWWSVVHLLYVANYVNQSIPDINKQAIGRWPDTPSEPTQDEIRAFLSSDGQGGPRLWDTNTDTDVHELPPITVTEPQAPEEDRSWRLGQEDQQAKFKEGMRAPNKNYYLRRVRNATVVKHAKDANEKKNRFLTCENPDCGLQPANPKSREEGRPFFKGMNKTHARAMIQGHHIVPFAQQKGVYTITKEDILCLCKNCHDVWHIKGNEGNIKVQPGNYN